MNLMKCQTHIMFTYLLRCYCTYHINFSRNGMFDYFNFQGDNSYKRVRKSVRAFVGGGGGGAGGRRR